jgi:hypothetical protein
MQPVENAHLMGESYRLASPALGKVPFPRDLLLFGLAPDVNVGAILQSRLAAVFLREGKNPVLCLTA